jgi:hypothetical protein
MCGCLKGHSNRWCLSVLQVVSDIGVIEKAIKVACDRNHASTGEWDQYFRQFLAYMTDGMYD